MAGVSLQRTRKFSNTPIDAEPEVILYEKSPGQVQLVKSGFGFSCFHSLYWVWYAIDFVPTVNAAQMTELHVDPMIPTVGLVFACIVQAIFTGYPLRLVSKLAWRPASQELKVYTHSLPFVRPSSSAAVSPLGDVRLDPASREAQKLATQGELQHFKGMLAVGKPGQWPPFLVDIRQATEVKEPEIMLELLLQPERVSKESLDLGDSRINKTAGSKRKKGGRRRR